DIACARRRLPTNGYSLTHARFGLALTRVVVDLVGLAPVRRIARRAGGRMAGYVDPTKEAFAAFRADDRPGQSICLIGSNCAPVRPIRTGAGRPGRRPMRLTGGRQSRFSRASEDRSSGA